MRTLEDLKRIEIIKFMGLYYKKVYPLIYLADREHLLKWGRTISRDSYLPLQSGSTPVNIKNIIKKAKDPLCDDIVHEHLAIKVDNRTGKEALFINKPIDLDVFSDSDIEIMRDILKKYGDNSLKELILLTKGSAWKQAQYIDKINIAIEGGADEGMVEYIKQKQKKLDLEQEIYYHKKAFKAKMLLDYWNDKIKSLKNKKGKITFLNEQAEIKEIHMKLRHITTIDNGGYVFGIIRIITETDNIEYPLPNLTMDKLTENITWEES